MVLGKRCLSFLRGKTVGFDRIDTTDVLQTSPSVEWFQGKMREHSSHLSAIVALCFHHRLAFSAKQYQGDHC